MEKSRNEKILREIEKAQVISFDIFDTLLLRPFTDSTDVFAYIEEKYCWKGFKAIRKKAEIVARNNSVNEDITYDEIYQRIPEYDPSIELETEKQILRFNPEIKELFEYSVRSNKKVIIISDMYLPKEFLVEVLKVNGYEGYEGLYISASEGVTKASGNLYKRVLNRLQIAPHALLHIGDNVVSDYTIPKKLGMKACYYPKVCDQYLSKKPFRTKMCGSLPGSMFIQLSAIYSLQNRDYWERFGYEIAGALCYAYTMWVFNEVKDVKTDADLLFVARDGYLLKLFFEAMNGEKRNNITSYYVYAPRMIQLISALNREDGIEHFERKHFEALIKYYSQELPEVGSTAELPSLKQYVLENKAALMRKAEIEQQEYKDYISGLGIGKGKTYIVDSRTENYSAQKLIEKTIKKETIGLYWVIGSENSMYLAKAYQKEKQNVLLSWQLIEFILSAPTPPIKAIRACAPVYSEGNSFEGKRREIFKKIETGAKDFLSDVVAQRLIEINVDEKIIRTYINDYCEHGNKEDIEHFEEVKFSSNPDHTDSMELMPFFVKPRNMDEYRRYIFKKLTLHPRVYSLIRRLYHIMKR